MRHPFPLLILLITLLIGRPGRAQIPANNSLSFESLKGKLPMPVDRFISLKTYEQWLNESKDRPRFGYGGNAKSLTIKSDSSMTVKNVAAGKVLSIFLVDGTYTVFVSHAKYFITYSCLDSVFVEKDEAITVGQSIGKIFTISYGGLYELELNMYNNQPQPIDPYPWFAHSRYF